MGNQQAVLEDPTEVVAHPVPREFKMALQTVSLHLGIADLKIVGKHEDYVFAS